jgi:hypothetical protein
MPSKAHLILRSAKGRVSKDARLVIAARSLRVGAKFAPFAL